MTAVFDNKSILVIFAYAPAGLGHLRVTNALYRGLPSHAHALLLGSHDELIRVLHRYTSVNPLVRAIFEWAQSSRFQTLFTSIYRKILRSNTKDLYNQMLTILDQRLETPKTVLIIATHFGLAHQLAVIKNRLCSERNLRVFLAVQVTDDTPQYIWYIPGADVIFVPSDRTKKKLENYILNMNYKKVNFSVNPYPVNPVFSQPFNNMDLQSKKDQLTASHRSYIHIAVPISGAAVGTKYFEKLMNQLYLKSQRYSFHVVTKIAPFTENFIRNINDRPYIKLYTSANDRGVIDQYDQVYNENIISMEITKPSEQTFKSLIEPYCVGGPIMLFANPVGKQEEDNLYFLRRHHLMPSISEQKIIWEKANKNQLLSADQKAFFLEKARSWRGLLLPFHSYNSAEFIHWCQENSIFLEMQKMRFNPTMACKYDECLQNELNSNGVREFWKKTADLIR